MTTKYTPQETEALISLYNQGIPVEEIAARVNKSTKSVIAKLSRMEVYVGVDPKPRWQTKLELVEGLEDRLTLSRGSLSSMIKMDRDQIVTLVEHIAKPQVPWAFGAFLLVFWFDLAWYGLLQLIAA